jgi:hypothetical protein
MSAQQQQLERLSLLSERLCSLLRPDDACMLLAMLERAYRTLRIPPFRARP